MRYLNIPALENCATCKLRARGFFCDLPQQALRDFEAIQISTGVPAGATVFVEGERARSAYILCSGLVKLTATSGSGKSMILEIVKPGAVLGLAAIIQGESYDVTAQTLRPSQLNVVLRDDFIRFLKQHGEAAQRMAEQLSRNCRAAGDRLRSIALASSARERLAHLLLKWVEETLRDESGSCVIVGMTHEEIAQLLGLTRETVTRTLSDFRRRQIVEFRGAQLRIRDQSALRSIAHAA
jgi:CRP/FNR family cyclic AMP-dependent transcriptional regulator